MKPFLCPLEATMSKIGGKYKMAIVYHLLRSGVLRYKQLHRRMPEATDKMLTQQLRQLEDAGIVHREVYPVVPPKTEYSLTEYGLTLGPAILEMALWGMEHMPGTFSVWDDEADSLLSDEDSDRFMQVASQDPRAMREAFAQSLHLAAQVADPETAHGAGPA